MKQKYYIYGFLFPKGNLEIGVFSLNQNLWEGDTDENVHTATLELCKRKGWDHEKIKCLTFKEIGEQFIKEMVDVESGILRPGNVGAQGGGESGTRSGDGAVQGRSN